MIRERIDRSVRLINQIDEQISEPEIDGDPRKVLSAICAHLARQHHRAIVNLVSEKMYASAAALLRVHCEAYIRSIWLHECAIEAELESFRKDEDIKFWRMIEALEAHHSFNTGVLRQIKETSWSRFCSFTHTGYKAVVRQKKGRWIEDNFDESEIVQMLDYSDAVGLMTAIQLGALANDIALQRGILEMAKQYSS